MNGHLEKTYWGWEFGERNSNRVDCNPVFQNAFPIDNPITMDTLKNRFRNESKLYERTVTVYDIGMKNVTEFQRVY